MDEPCIPSNMTLYLLCIHKQTGQRRAVVPIYLEIGHTIGQSMRVIISGNNNSAIVSIMVKADAFSDGSNDLVFV